MDGEFTTHEKYNREAPTAERMKKKSKRMELETEEVIKGALTLAVVWN